MLLANLTQNPMTSDPTPRRRAGRRAQLFTGLALLGSAFCTLSAADFNYRYYRFKPTDTLNGGTATQMSEFKFFTGT